MPDRDNYRSPARLHCFAALQPAAAGLHLVHPQFDNIARNLRHQPAEIFRTRRKRSDHARFSAERQRFARHLQKDPPTIHTPKVELDPAALQSQTEPWERWRLAGEVLSHGVEALACEWIRVREQAEAVSLQ